MISRRVLWRLIWVCAVRQCPSQGFTDNPVYTALWHHSGKNSGAINNRYLEFGSRAVFISLLNDNHVDNYLKKIMAFV